MSEMLEDRRLLLGGGALIAVLVVALAWVLAVGPQLAAADEFATQRIEAETQNADLQRQNATLAEQKAGIDGLEADLVAAQAGLPKQNAFPELTRQVTATAKATGVAVDSISINPATPVAPAAASASAQGAETQDQRQQITVSFTSTGSFKKQTAFLRAMQTGPRRLLVTSSQVTTAETSRVASVDAKTTMITQATVFTAP